MKKNFLKTITSSIIIAAILTLGISPVLAATVSPKSDPANQGSTPISATVGDSYTLTIPDTYTFGTVYKTHSSYHKYSNEGAGSVNLTDVVLSAGKKINVTVGHATTQDYTLKDGVTPTPNTINFDMFTTKHDDGTADTAMGKGDNIITDADTDINAALDCYAGIDVSTVSVAGNYSGSITFHVTVA